VSDSVTLLASLLTVLDVSRRKCNMSEQKIKCSNSDRQILISEIQARPPLRNDGHPDYKKTEKTDKLWAETGIIMGFSGEKKIFWFLFYLHQEHGHLR
jgi:hypothetical protein